MFGRDRCKENIRFWRHRQAETLETLQQLGVPIETGKIVGKKSFQEHLIASMDACFNKGFEQIIVVGNDTPDLQLKLLKRAARGLRRSSTVLQPAIDGGINLLGIDRKSFERIKHKSLPWQQKNLLESLLNLLNQGNIECELLPTGNDLDNLIDLASHVFCNIKSKLAKLVAILLFAPLNKPKALLLISAYPPFLQKSSGRAPPVLN